LHSAAPPASTSPIRNAGPATPAATPVTTNSPAPMIAPNPTPTASTSRSSRRSPLEAVRGSPGRVRVKLSLPPLAYALAFQPKLS
jgi:hypothetical protein